MKGASLKPLFRVLLACCLLGCASQVQAVTLADCRDEQEAWIEAKTRNPENASAVRNQMLSGENDSIPWWISEINKINTSIGVIQGLDVYTRSLNQDIDTINSFNSRPYSILGDSRLYPEIVNESAARNRFKICIHQARLRELSGGGAAATPVTQSPPPAAPCAADRMQSMNQEIADSDSRLAAFMQNTPGTTAGTTGMLKVVMWATKSQADALRRYCPGWEDATSRIADLEASFKSAQAACDQIQAGGSKCAPMTPEALQTSIAEAARPAAPRQAPSTSKSEPAPTSTSPRTNTPSDSDWEVSRGRRQ